VQRFCHEADQHLPFLLSLAAGTIDISDDARVALNAAGEEEMDLAGSAFAESYGAVCKKLIKKVRKDKRMMWCGHVAPCAGRCAGSRQPDHARSSFVVRSRCHAHTCSYVAQPVCPQVPYDVHTNTATLILGLAQPPQWEDRNQVRNKGGTGSTSL
jgi:hypothetical protein